MDHHPTNCLNILKACIDMLQEYIQRIFTLLPVIFNQVWNVYWVSTTERENI